MKAMTLQRLRRRLWIRSGIALVLLASVFYLASTLVIVYHFPSGEGLIYSTEGNLIVRYAPSIPLTPMIDLNERIFVWRDRVAIAYRPHVSFMNLSIWSVRLPWTNIIAFAAIVITVWNIRTYRRGLRLLRAGCKQCGYDIAGLSQCPECGTARI